jgi:hypothetical protein
MGSAGVLSSGVHLAFLGRGQNRDTKVRLEDGLRRNSG